MSRYSQYNKNDTYLANLNYANQQKERRNKEELKEIELDRIAMEKLQLELDQEKQLEKERKNQIRKQQYEDYSNYFKQKYSETPQSKENNINIKLGNENRFIRRPSYQQQMENLCLNPTRNKDIYNHTPIENFSEAGRQYQRGYSHGYNILTGEAYSPELLKGKNSKNVNLNINLNDNIGINDNKQKEQIQNNNYRNNENNIILDDKEKEDLRQYQEYMEMKRKKEQEEQEREALYYMQQQDQKQNQITQEREQDNYITNQKENIQPYENTHQQELNYDNKEYNIREPTYDQMRPNSNDIPPEYKNIYDKERIPPNQIIEQAPLEEIPPEYREMYLREQMEKENRKPSYQNVQEEINTYVPKEKEEINPKGNENIINKETNQTQDYRQYLLSKQDISNKEKEEEEIYQNMLKEKEREQIEINQEKEKELYRQYLLEQQRQNQNQIREQETNQLKEDQQYQDINEIRQDKIPNNKINEVNKENMPINTFEEYYKQKNINIPENQSEIKNPPKYENDNYPPYSQYPEEVPGKNIYPPSQEQLSEEQAYLMYQQQQKNRQEMEQIEMEKERARQILERQQKDKINEQQSLKQNQNDYYPSNYNDNPSAYYNPNNQESRKMSEFNSAKMEYMKNRQKNLITKDNIFSVSEVQKPPPKYNNEPLTNADRLRIQREYAQFLDSQINAKNIRENKNKNNGLNMVQSSGYEVEGPNPYQQMRNKHSKLRDIPQDPYSVKNYNISNNSYLTSNPITNPVNSYKFVDKRRVPSGRLQNSGSSVVAK